MNAREISAVIKAQWSRKALVFTEVKNGPSYGPGQRRMDLLAIARTWSPITIKAVEVKVSRSDFVRDTKWPEYLDLCNQFYWACPPKLISREEVDPRCGLLYVTPERVRTVKAAPFRDVEPDPLTLLYLLLWREEAHTPENTPQQIREEMEENARVGTLYKRFVSQKLREANRRVAEAEQTAEQRFTRERKLAKWFADHDVYPCDIEARLEHALTLERWTNYQHAIEASHKATGKLLAAMEIKP